jgi:hypothetical protein
MYETVIVFAIIICDYLNKNWFVIIHGTIFMCHDEDMSNEGTSMLLLHVSTNLKSRGSNGCEEYWSNP